MAAWTIGPRIVRRRQLAAPELSDGREPVPSAGYRGASRSSWPGVGDLWGADIRRLAGVLFVLGPVGDSSGLDSERVDWPLQVPEFRHSVPERALFSECACRGTRERRVDHRESPRPATLAVKIGLGR